MARFEQTVKIDLKVENINELGQLGDFAGELEELGDTMEDLDRKMAKIDRSIAGMADTAEGSGDTLRDVADGMEEVGKAQKNLEEDGDDTINTLRLEDSISEQLEGDLDGLEAAKKAAADANSKLGEQSKFTADDLEREMGVAEKDARAIGLLDEKKKDADTSSRALRNSLDETTDSMRAANKVSGLFEDGLGSLSINLGAFTLALKNFLTQVPLLLAALGTLGAAATGVASAFIAAGTAIGGAIAVGAIANAESLAEQYGSIEGKGEALQVMMRDMRDMILEAIRPLMENEEVIDVFSRAIEGIANSIHLVALTLDELMQIDAEDLNVLGPLSEGSDEAAKDVMGIADLFEAFGDRLSEPFRELNKAMSFAFINLQDEFLDMSEGIVSALRDMIRFSTKFVDGITEATETLDQIRKTVAEMAKLGKTIISGLMPVFNAFAGIVSDVAAVINSMNAEFVAAAITFAALIGALSRVGGFLSSIVAVIPNFVVALNSANGSVTQLGRSFLGFLKESRLVGAGIIDLHDSIADLRNELKLLLVQNELAEDTFDDVDGEIDELNETLESNTRDAIENAQSLEELQDELVETALESDASAEQIEAMGDELRNVGLQANFAKEELDDIRGVRSSATRRQVVTPVPAGGLRKTADAADDAEDKLDDVNKKGTASKGIFASLTATIGGSFLPTSISLTSVVASLGAALVLIVAAGTAAVGIIANLEEVIDLLSVTAEVMGDMFHWIASSALDVFITTWNMLFDVVFSFWLMVRPLVDVFNELSGETDVLSRSLENVVMAADVLINIIVSMLKLVGLAFTRMGLVVNFFSKLFATNIKFIVELIGFFTDAISNASDNSGILGQAIRFISNQAEAAANMVDKLISGLVRLPEITEEAMQSFLQETLDQMNKLIDLTNKIIKKQNQLTGGRGMEQIDTVTMDDIATGGEGARIGEGEVAAGTDQFIKGLTGEKDKKITYNEDNSTNIEQTVDADPEDQAQLSRVVTDAVAEANSFERRRQGGQ